MECPNGFLGGRLGMIPSPLGALPGSLPTPLWAAQIAAATPLPDARLNSRLERLLIHLANKPLNAFPQAMPDWHQAKANYRFFANERVVPEAHLTGLRDTPAGALRSLRVLHVIHDTTTCSYSSLKHTTGLGYVNDLEAARGLHCHSSLAIRPDGVAVGLLHQHYWDRLELRTTRAQDRDLEDKESIKWIHGLNATKQAVDSLAAEQRPRVVHIMDREGDIHEVFAKVLAWGHGAIIRRYRNRSVAEGPGDADEAIWQAPVIARARLKLPASRGRKARTAVVELRTRDLTLTPKCHVGRDRQPLRLTMVAVREGGPPAEGGGADRVAVVDDRAGADEEANSGSGADLCLALADRRLSLGLEAGLPDRATPTGDAGAPGKGLDLVCRGGGAAVAVTRPGPAGAGGPLHGSADGGRMAGVVRACHG